MLHSKKILAIIPARGGSKGLPGKNILELGGLPLISWTIKAAQESQYIDRVILSSDDAEIAAVARAYQCEVPFVRPQELATDTADAVSVMLHAIELEGADFDIIVLLQPTSPFRNAECIDAALEQYEQQQATSLVSVAQLDKSPEWLYRLNVQNNTLIPLLAQDKPVVRRQDSQPAYYLNGALYIFDKNYFIQTQGIIDESTQAYIMDSKRSLDIDTREDFEYAQLTFENFL